MRLRVARKVVFGRRWEPPKRWKGRYWLNKGKFERAVKRWHRYYRHYKGFSTDEAHRLVFTNGRFRVKPVTNPSTGSI